MCDSLHAGYTCNDQAQRIVEFYESHVTGNRSFSIDKYVGNM
jgi:hypothetical protein